MAKEIHAGEDPPAKRRRHATDSIFRDAYVSGKSRPRTSRLVVHFQNAPHQDLQELALTPANALDMIAAVLAALRGVKLPELDAALRKWAAEAFSEPKRLTTDYFRASSAMRSGIRGRSRNRQPRRWNLTAKVRVFMSALTARSTHPGCGQLVLLTFEEANALLDQFAIDARDAVLLAEALITAIEPFNFAETRDLAMQMKERP